GYWRSAPPLTKPARSGSTPRMRPALVLAIALMVLCLRSATAMVGGAPAAAPTIARHVVLIVGSGGTFCSGVAIARDLVLTAAHCTQPGADYKLMELDAAHQPTLRDVAQIARHPQFDLKTLLGHRATADLTLLKLAAPLGQKFVPAPLAAPSTVAVGDAFTVAGFGVAVRGDGRSGGAAGRHRPARHAADPALRPRRPRRARRPRRLHRRFGRAGVRRPERAARGRRRGELVDRPEAHGRLRRAHRRDAAGALP